jgi:aminoglycoside phosphotransferase (APT) family kinase protein
MADAGLALAQERDVWRAAGQALVALHDLAVGESFGPSYRDGTCAASAIREARAFVMVDLDDWTERGLMLGCLDAGDLTVINAARDLVPAFEGERPTPCHRDYGPANWLVTADGAWAGVIDFEFARWDVRVADLTRYPDWEWMRRPDLVEAFLEGYGRSFSPAEEQQRLVGHVQYALSAIVWGRENSYHGFEAEGREALAHLAGLLD